MRGQPIGGYQRLRIVGQAAFGQDMAFALVERRQRFGQQLVPHVAFFGLGHALVFLLAALGLVGMVHLHDLLGKGRIKFSG